MKTTTLKLNCIKTVLFLVLSFLATTFNAQNQNLVDFFKPMEIQAPLVSSGIWGNSNVLPRDISNGLEDHKLDNWCYWDGKIMKDDIGKYHLYASRWSQSLSHSVGWKNDSKAIHAVSDNIMGPYEDKGLVYPNWNNNNPNWQKGRGHNITALRMHDGRYAVVSSEITPGNVFVSDSPDGPFEHLGQIQYDCNGFSCGLARYNFSPNHMSNVKILLRSDGNYMIIPRTTAPMLSENGILGPYKIMGNAVYNGIPNLPQEKNEDPTVWYSGGMYHIVYNHWPSKTSYHFSSLDGITDWKYRGVAYRKGIDKIFQYTDGTINDWEFIERTTAYLENGHVTHFIFSVIDVHKGSDGGNDNHGSKIVVVPFDGEAFDCYMQNVVREEQGEEPIDCDTILSDGDSLEIGNNNIKIIPSPFDDYIQIDTENRFQLEQVVISEVNGRIVKHIEGRAIQNENINSIDTRSFASGLYIISIETKNNGRYIKKLLKL